MPSNPGVYSVSAQGVPHIIRHQRFPEWSWRSFRRNWWRTSGEVWKGIFELLLLGKSSEAFFTKTPPQISPSNFTTRFWVVAFPTSLNYSVFIAERPFLWQEAEHHKDRGNDIVLFSRAARWGGGFPDLDSSVLIVLFRPFWVFPAFFFGIFPILSGSSGNFPDLSFASFSAYKHHLRGTVPKGSASQSGPFPRKCGKRPGLQTDRHIKLLGGRSDIFLIFLLGGGEGGVRGARKNCKSQKGGGSPGREGLRAERVSAAIWGIFLGGGLG